MEKFKWFLVIFLCGIILNVFLLYYFLFSLRNEIMSLKKEEDTPSINNVNLEPTVSTAPVVSTNSGTLACSDCLTQIADLKQQLAKISTPVIKETQKTVSTPVDTYVKEYYVYIGDGNSTAKDWTDVSWLKVDIDTAKYKKIKSVRFEGTLSNPSGVGTVSVRLFNKTDQHPVWFSDLSMEGPTDTFKQSDSITLDSGNKTYQVQMKSTLGAKVFAYSARVKITLE